MRFGTRDFGTWDPIIRELAKNDPTQFDAVLRWPVREGLLCYLELMKQSELEEWRFRTILAFLGHAKDLPKPPEIMGY